MYVWLLGKIGCHDNTYQKQGYICGDFSPKFLFYFLSSYHTFIYFSSSLPSSLFSFIYFSSPTKSPSFTFICLYTRVDIAEAISVMFVLYFSFSLNHCNKIIVILAGSCWLYFIFFLNNIIQVSIWNRHKYWTC